MGCWCCWRVAPVPARPARWPAWCRPCRPEPGARIHLAAPTGKAAARLRSATGSATPCSTLHRLLESRGDHFGRNRRHPLALDLVVVDEVSMVDMALMGALLEALPEDCRLVLVGDPAQLAPVGPGSVLRELQRPTPWRSAMGPAVTLRTTCRNDGAIAASPPPCVGPSPRGLAHDPTRSP